MSASPLWMPLPERHAAAVSVRVEEGDEEAGTPSPPLRLTVNWKTPVLVNTVPPLEEEDDDDDNDDDGDSALPPLPPLTWRVPVIASTPEPEITDEQSPSPTPPQLAVQEVPTPSSSSLAIQPDDQEGVYELESVLLEEEEYNIPEYCRHRKSTGINNLDDRLSLEPHFVVKEEEGLKGLVCGSTLEVAGTPGSGKTTLLVQMAVRERLNGIYMTRYRSKGKARAEADDEDWPALGDRTQQVLLIDTEGGIGMDRIVSIAQWHIEQLDQTLVTNRSALLLSVLAGIHYIRCTSDVELLALFRTILPSTRRDVAASLQDATPIQSDVKMRSIPRLPPRTTMIFIDTISYHVRASLSDEARHLRNQRNLLLYEFKHFAERCRRRGINLVLANQMGFTIVNKDGVTTNLSDKDGEGRLIPLLRNQSESILGPDEWRIVLFRAGSHHDAECSRFAQFIGQPVLIGLEGDPQILSPTWLPFTVDEGGIVDGLPTATA